MGIFAKKKKSKATRTKSTTSSKPTPAKTAGKKQDEPNQWRKGKGVDEPLRIGRGIRTRDEFFAGQDDKIIHPEKDKRELYRRGIVLDIDDEENLALTKVHTIKSDKHPTIPGDVQKRKYERKLQTASGSNTNPKPIRLEKDKFELAPSNEDVSERQAKIMRADIEKSSKLNKKRLQEFRNKKRK